MYGLKMKKIDFQLCSPGHSQSQRVKINFFFSFSQFILSRIYFESTGIFIKYFVAFLNRLLYIHMIFYNKFEANWLLKHDYAMHLYLSKDNSLQHNGSKIYSARGN